MLPEVAVIVVDPTARLATTPAALIVATEAVFEAQVTEAEIFRDVPSEYVPVAVNWLVKPTGTDTAGGVTAMDSRVAVIVALVVAVPVRPLVSVTVSETA
jgi:uncharacterized membrane protein